MKKLVFLLVCLFTLQTVARAAQVPVIQVFQPLAETSGAS